MNLICLIINIMLNKRKGLLIMDKRQWTAGQKTAGQKTAGQKTVGQKTIDKRQLTKDN